MLLPEEMTLGSTTNRVLKVDAPKFANVQIQRNIVRSEGVRVSLLEIVNALLAIGAGGGPTVVRCFGRDVLP